MTQTPPSFTRVVTKQYFNSLVKEARRVKYIIQGKLNDAILVKDDETGEQVFFGVMHSSGKHYIANFNTKYWQYPEMV